MKTKKEFYSSFRAANDGLIDMYRQILDELKKYIDENGENKVITITRGDEPVVITTEFGGPKYSYDEYTECKCLALRLRLGEVYMFCAPSCQDIDFETDDLVYSDDLEEYWYCLNWDDNNAFQYNIERISHFMQTMLEDEADNTNADTDSDKALRDNLKERFKSIVEKYGDDGELWVFDFCTDMGASLEDSTIDSISVSDSGDVTFYFDQKDGDYISIDSINASAQDLQIFYEKLCVWLKTHADR